MAAIIAEVLGAERGTAERILCRLVGEDVLNDIACTIRAALRSADAAWTERPDLFDNPAQPDTGAEIATAAVARALAPLKAKRDAPPQELAAKVAKLRYKDWTFRLVKLAGTGAAVEVRATLDNTCHPGAPFTTTRAAAIVGDDVAGAAYRAVMLIEAHEAAERLRVDGRAVLDPHRAGAVPAPGNARSRAR